MLAAAALAGPSPTSGRAWRAPCASRATASSTRQRGALACSSGPAAGAPSAGRRARRGDRAGPRASAAAGGGSKPTRSSTPRGPRRPLLTPGLPIVPRKGHLVITDRYPGFCRHQLVELGYLKSAHTPRPRVGRLQRPAARDRPDAARLLARVRGLGRLAQRPAPRPDAPPRARVHAGARAPRARSAPGSASGRRRPTTCRSSGRGSRGLWVAAGHEGLGITTALGTAR